MQLVEIPRRTLGQAVHLAGRGLHSGVPVEVTLSPATDGIRFDYGDEWVRATPAMVSDTTRSTSLGAVRTVEHLMSALSGLAITDVDVHLSAPELPAMDGSAEPFCAAMSRVDTVDLGVSHIPFPDVPVTFEDGHVSVRIAVGDGVWSYHYESSDLWPYQRVVEIDLVETDYRECVAGARTFLHEADLASLATRGLAQGLDRPNALIVGSDGYVTAARMPEEKVTHKILDLIGDLYLLGIPARYLNVSARRSGHRTNVGAAQRVAAVVGALGEGRAVDQAIRSSE